MSCPSNFMSAHTPPPRLHQSPPSPTVAERCEIAEHLGDMISIHTPDGTYQYVSPAVRELLGWQPEELVGRWCYDLFHPDDVAKVSGVHRNVLRGTPATVVYRLRRKAGGYAWVETTTRVVSDEHGRAREIVCSTRPARQHAPHPGGESYEACVARVTQVLLSEAIRPLLQPIVDLEDGRVVAYEALARFPGQPVHAADRWFADAWHVELGIPLELLAVRAALATLPQLPEDVALSVNVSPETVATPDFLEAIGESAERVIVEITEHRRLDDDGFGSKLAPLRALGGRIAIDDFGAGYASLSQVLAIAPDSIKLDRSLTMQLDESPVARALTAAIVSFTDEVGIDVVAEGIEDEEQVETLRSLGIHRAQGYHLGRPMSIDALVAERG